MTLAGRDTSVANRLHWASASSNVQPQIKHRVSSVLFNGRVLVLCVRPLSASQRYVVSGASTANPTSTARSGTPETPCHGIRRAGKMLLDWRPLQPRPGIHHHLRGICETGPPRLSRNQR